MKRAVTIGVALAILGALGWWWGRRSVEPTPLPTATATTERTAVPLPAPAKPTPRPAVTPLGRAADPHLFVKAGWGSGPTQLGKKSASESAPEGPMSLVVDKEGNLYVLDQVNHRVQRWSAGQKLLAPISISSDTAQDLALGKRGSVALLDRLGERNVQLVSADGKPLGEVGLVGAHLPESGGSTGLFTDREGNLWVEREHEELVRVADSDGNSDPDRPTAPGRPTSDGRVWLSGAILDRTSGTASVRGLDASGAVVWQSTVSLGAPILYLSLLDSDGAGNVYLGGHVGRESSQPPYGIVGESLVLISLLPDGSPRGMMTLAAAPPIAENFRELSVGDDGTIYRMVMSDSGVTIETYRF